jgi:hypothetical protein
MPLYTYILGFKGSLYAAQGRHSNFKGFVSSWSESFPSGALPSLTPALKKELAEKAYSGQFEEVPNRTHVWRKTIALSGDDFVVYAVQTES